jgi:hypothetical protein
MVGGGSLPLQDTNALKRRVESVIAGRKKSEQVYSLDSGSLAKSGYRIVRDEKGQSFLQNLKNPDTKHQIEYIDRALTGRVSVYVNKDPIDKMANSSDAKVRQNYIDLMTHIKTPKQGFFTKEGFKRRLINTALAIPRVFMGRLTPRKLSSNNSKIHATNSNIDSLHKTMQKSVNSPEYQKLRQGLERAKLKRYGSLKKDARIRSGLVAASLIPHVAVAALPALGAYHAVEVVRGKRKANRVKKEGVQGKEEVVNYRRSGHI